MKLKSAFSAKHPDLIMALLLTLAPTAVLNAQTGKILNEFQTPGRHVTGICYDGKNIWQADDETDKIYCTDAKSGKVIKSIESPAYWPTGLAWDGKHLWNADFRGRTDVEESADGMIFEIDPKDGTVLKTLGAPCKSPKGLAWDGEYLWTVDDVQDKVIQFDTSDGTTINSFAAPAKSPKGITYADGWLWISDNGNDEIYMVDPKTGCVIIIMDAPGPCIHGIAASGESLWAADYENDKIYELKIKDRTPFVRKDKRTLRMTYHHDVACFGPGGIKSLDIQVALPENRDNQEIIGDIQYNVKPTEIATDQWGQRTAHFHFDNLKPGEKAQVAVTETVNTYNLRYFIYPEFVGTLADIPADVKSLFLADDVKYQINSETIQKTAKEVLGGETNPYWIVRKLHQYLIGHLYYNMDGAWDTAPTVIRNGHGSCSEYTFVFIALCRAAGLPARYVGSAQCREDNAYLDEVFHRWVEVYIPGYGWIPTDPTHGDRELPCDQARPIGFVSNKALITTQSGGGSTTLHWNYNSDESYVTDPKTNLTTNHYADWVVLR